MWGFILPVGTVGGWESACAWPGRWLARCLTRYTAGRRYLVLTPDPTPLSCCRVPLPCSGSPYARRLRTSPHYYYSTTRTVRPFIHERTAPPRDLGPLITDPLRSPSPSPVNVLRTPPCDKRQSSLRPGILLQNHLNANI